MTINWISLSRLFQKAEVSPAEGASVPGVAVEGLTDDSRQVTRGACFVAVSGTVRDGATFIDAAIEAGACAIVVDADSQTAIRDGVAVVRVANAREALAKLAAAYYGLRGGEAFLPLVGVTGTNGKTTVTWLIRSILRAAGHRPALLGTIEYDLLRGQSAAPLTTPGAIALCQHLATARDAGASHAVFEVSSHALEQRRCDGLTFAAGVFTNLTQDHLDYHQTMEAYAAAKRRLFEMLSPTAHAVINADDAHAAYFAGASGAPVTMFGIQSKSADVRCDIARMDRSGMTLSVLCRSASYEIRSPLVGKHNASNLLAAAATAEALGVSVDAIRTGLESVSGVRGRLERVEPDGWPFSVMVDYAHTDDALRNVLTAIRPLTPGRVICVFGCGGDRDRTKRPRMAAVVGDLADVAVVTSDNSRMEDPEEIIREILPGFPRGKGCRVVVESDRREAIGLAIAEARAGDSVLIAGKGHEDYQLVGGRVLHFDDVEEARVALAAAKAEVAAVR